MAQVALDFIGKRGNSVGVARTQRIQYARDILQRELLPHVGIGPLCETKKVSCVITMASSYHTDRLSYKGMLLSDSSSPSCAP